VSRSQPTGESKRRNAIVFAVLALALAAAFVAISVHPLAAQVTARVTGVDPASGKANDIVTIAGENLEKSHVSAVFLSDDKDDHKASVVSQGADKIVIKVPDVKPGDYNVSIQAGNSIFIQPIKFTVQ
jgi:IPT/TIG domain-containing protein